MIYDYSDQLSLFSHDVLLPINYKNGPAFLNSNITAEVQRMWITGEMMKNKTPTYEDYQNHTGLHYHRLWKATGDDWICPGCGRSKFQIMRWTLRFPKTQNAFMDWVAALHKHHDHSADYRGLDVPRFPQTLICDQCNSADGAVKKKLGLPKNFSFSPKEMRVFIKATPHEKHEIDYKRALELFQSTVIMT